MIERADKTVKPVKRSEETGSDKDAMRRKARIKARRSAEKFLCSKTDLKAFIEASDRA